MAAPAAAEDQEVAVAVEASGGAVVEASGGASAPPVPALYVGDLHEEVRDEHLFEAFSKVGPVTSVRVCCDSATGRSLGYGYVNYILQPDATIAMEKLNHSLLLNKPIRVMWSNRDPNARKSGVGNVFVKNFSDSVDNASLQELFSKFGDILSCKVARNEDGTSRGYGFVQFASQESADSAIQNLNNSSFDGKQLHVAGFIKKSERPINNPDAKYTNLYMKNLDQDITEELIKLKFSQFGPIVSVKIVKDFDGNSKGFGFVSFHNPESAVRAKEAMNGMQLGSKTLYVSRAQKKSERQQFLQRLYEEKKNEIIMKSMGSNIYIKNIDDAVDDNALRERFSECGTITSAKIMRDEKGISKGFGFVCYSTPDEAKNAVANLHGYMFYGKPLYVAMAQRKEERQAKLHLHFAQLAGFAGAAGPVIPTGYPPFYYAHPGVVPQVPPNQGLMYQPVGLRHGWRPNPFAPPSRPTFQPIHSPMMPNTPRQPRHNRGRMNGNMMFLSGHSANHMSHSQPAKDSTPHQLYGHPKYMPNGRHRDGMTNGSTVPPGDSNSPGNELFSSMLAAAPPEEQKQMLGDRLYPLVEKLQPDLAKKITGMLLEMDNSEVLVLLYSPELLAAKVEEGVQVLEMSKTKADDQESLHPGFLPASAEVAVN